MRDNVALMALQSALNKANPQGLPTNLVLQQFAAPNDVAGLPDSLTTTLTPTSSMLYGGVATFSDWASATLTDADATTRAPSLILAKNGSAYYTSGTAQSGSIDLSAAGAASGASVTVHFSACLPFAAVSAAMEVRFSTDGSTWGAWQAVTNGGTLTAVERYCEVLATLSTTDTSQTPQLGEISLAVATPAKWDMAEYNQPGFPDTLMWLGMLPTGAPT